MLRHKKTSLWYLCKYDNLISIDGLNYSNYRYIIQTGSLITIRIHDVINMSLSLSLSLSIYIYIYIYYRLDDVSYDVTNVRLCWSIN